MKTLIRNVIVNNNKVDILIEDKKISEIGSNLIINANKVINGKGCYALSGNCNCFFDGGLEDCDKLLCQGVTTVFDFSNDNLVTRKLVQLGLKVFTAVGDFTGANVIDESYLDLEVKRVIELGVVAPIIYLANPNIEDESQYSEAIKYAKKNNYLISTSVSEYLEDVGEIDNQYGMSPIALLESYGFLDYKNLLIDCVFVDKDDVNILNNYDTSTICTCPTKNLINGSGIAPIYSFHRNKINMVIGGNISNIFNELELVKNLQCGNLNEKNILSIHDVKPYINENAHKVFNEIGGINVGDFADIVLVDECDLGSITPLNVKYVFVNGNPIYDFYRKFNV